MKHGLFITIFALCQLGVAELRADQLKVVTTLSTFADLVEAVGGERIEVSSIASPRFNPHFIEPRPSDVLRVRRADLFVHGGLDLEVWRGSLVDAAARPDVRPGGKRELGLAEGVHLLNVPSSLSRAQGDVHQFGNPHYWHSPANGVVMAETIARKLSELDTDGARYYHERLEEFRKELSAGMERWKQMLAPYRGRELVGYHDEWAYLMAFGGLTMEQFLEPKPGIPPSPQHLLTIERYIRSRGITGIVQATFYSLRAARSLAEATGANVVLLCQNVDELRECSSYRNMLDYNVAQIVKSFV